MEPNPICDSHRALNYFIFHTAPFKELMKWGANDKAFCLWRSPSQNTTSKAGDNPHQFLVLHNTLFSQPLNGLWWVNDVFYFCIGSLLRGLLGTL